MLSSDTGKPCSYIVTDRQGFPVSEDNAGKTSLLFQTMKIEESIGDYHVQ